MKVAAAPVSWGVFEPTDGVDAETFLDDVVVTGYEGTELGPSGYLGDAGEIKWKLGERELALVGAFLPLPFTDHEARGRNVAEAEALLKLLMAATPQPDQLPTLLLSDAYREPARIAVAGRVQQHPETWLDDSGWREMREQVVRVAELARASDFDVVFHPHGGSYVETPQEIDRLLGAIESEQLGLCLDTGHAFFGGDDPARLLRDYGSRIELVHLKDVELGVMAQLKGEGFGIDEAWRRGVFCELGRGGVDLDQVLGGLRGAGYNGWIVVEQDRILEPGQDLKQLRADGERNRNFLRDRGI